MPVARAGITPCGNVVFRHREMQPACTMVLSPTKRHVAALLFLLSFFFFFNFYFFSSVRRNSSSFTHARSCRARWNRAICYPPATNLSATSSFPLYDIPPRSRRECGLSRDDIVHSLTRISTIQLRVFLRASFLTDLDTPLCVGTRPLRNVAVRFCLYTLADVCVVSYFWEAWVNGRPDSNSDSFGSRWFITCGFTTRSSTISSYRNEAQTAQIYIYKIRRNSNWTSER